MTLLQERMMKFYPWIEKQLKLQKEVSLKKSKEYKELAKVAQK